MQIINFPYISLARCDEVPFPDLNAVVWNFDSKSQQYIPDSATREHIARILAINVRGRRSISHIGVLSIGDTDFREFNEADMKAADEVRLRLFLASSARNNTRPRGMNTGLAMTTAENFAYVIQNFQVGDEHIAESAGAIVRQTAGGYTLNELTFQAPGYIVLPTPFSIDPRTLHWLSELGTRKPRVYERILRASDLIYRSFFNDPYVDINSRILLVTAAFEILLNLPDGNQQRRLFKQAISDQVDDPGEKQISFWSERGTSRPKARQRGSRKVKWADRLYTLRSHIIHGNKIDPQEYAFEGVQRHIDIAIIFFVFLVHARINRSLGRKLFFDRIEWVKRNDDDGTEYEGFEFDAGFARRAIHEFLSRRRSRPTS